MRILGSTNVESALVSKVANKTVEKETMVKQGNQYTENKSPIINENVQSTDNNEVTKAKVQEAVSKLNEMLDVTNSTSKFLYHEGLNRYYVTVVDQKTEEVVKEIPPKKLLDAFYEMQKMLGMIVDEKI